MRLFVAMIVAFLVGSELSDKGAVVHHTVTGVVTQFEPGAPTVHGSVSRPATS